MSKDARSAKSGSGVIRAGYLKFASFQEFAMCGKFTQMASWNEVVAFSQSLTVPGNIAEVVVSTPMRFANIMRLNSAGQREMASMRWGFAAKNDTNPAGPKHMHARCETIDTKPTFAHAFAHGRGILLQAGLDRRIEINAPG